MPGSLRLGKIAGIDIYAHLSWFIILVLLTWSLASGWFAQLFPGWATSTYWIVAFISALLLFGCVLVHELAHALVAQASGLTVRNITLFIFGGVAHVEEDMKRPGVEFRVAIAGPIASFLLAGVAFLLVLPLRGSGASAEAALDYLAVANFLLGAFNLLPGFPLDGGRVLRSIIWKVDAHRLLRWSGLCICLHPARDHRVLHGELLQRPVGRLHWLVPLERSADRKYAGRTAIGPARRLCRSGDGPSALRGSGEHLCTKAGGSVLPTARTAFCPCDTR